MHFISKVLNRLLTALLTLFGLIFITFIIGRVLPIDPVLATVGDRASADIYEAVKIELGLHLPWYKQFYHYCLNMISGNFGTSFLTNNKVIDDLKLVFPATIELATLAMFISTFIGIPLGIFAAIYQNKWPDHLVRIIALFGNSISIFWLGLMALLIFYSKLEWAPSPGRLDTFYEYYTLKSGFLFIETALYGEWEIFFNALKHIMLPACILAYFKLALITRMTRTFMIEILHQEYILTAKIKGLPTWYIICVHAFRNALIPLTTIIGLSYAALLEGATFIETIYLWPGLGYYLTQALKNADMNAILGTTILIGTIFIVINLLTDTLYHLFDPRMKASN